MFSHELLLAGGSAADVHACRFGCFDGWFALAALDTCDFGYIEARGGTDMESESALQMTRKPRDFAPRGSRGSCGRCTSWGCTPCARFCRVGSDTHL